MQRSLNLFFLLFISHFNQAGAQTEKIDLAKLEKAFQQAPAVYTNYENLQQLLATRYEQLTAEQRQNIRVLLAQSTFSSITICSAQEAGTRITIQGKITDQDGKPIPSAKITFFQTDAKGYYAPPDATTKRMSESDARLYGVAQTNAQGEYELHTIQPANYPVKYEGRLIPQHIHFNIFAKGFSELKLQVAFDDDPAMKDLHWRSWAKDLDFPIVKFNMANGKKKGSVIIALKRQ